MSPGAALLLPSSTLGQCHRAVGPLGTNVECKPSLQLVGFGFRNPKGKVWPGDMKWRTPRFSSVVAAVMATMDRGKFLPDKKVPLYSHSLPSIEAWLQSLGFVQNKDDRAVWLIERPDWHAQLSLDITELYIRYLKSGPGTLDRDVERKFSYALSREDVENAVLGGPFRPAILQERFWMDRMGMWIDSPIGWSRIMKLGLSFQTEGSFVAGFSSYLLGGPNPEVNQGVAYYYNPHTWPSKKKELMHMEDAQVLCWNAAIPFTHHVLCAIGSQHIKQVWMTLMVQKPVNDMNRFFYEDCLSAVLQAI